HLHTYLIPRKLLRKNEILKVLFLITALLSAYAFAALPNPESLLIAPIAGSQHVS
ncbi:13603_t:CDS:2, partial [Gigaspora margarita]